MYPPNPRSFFHSLSGRRTCEVEHPGEALRGSGAGAGGGGWGRDFFGSGGAEQAPVNSAEQALVGGAEQAPSRRC